MNLKGIKSSEMNQSQKDRFSLYEVPRKARFIETESKISDYQDLGDR